MVNWCALTQEEIFDSLKTSENGLSEAEAKFRLEKFGKNQIVQISKTSPITIFLAQFKSVFIYILFFAAIFSVCIGHYIDFIVILIIILINSLVGFFQQYKAEKTMAEMKNLLVPKVQVFRDNHLFEINSSELVVGDVIHVSEGEKIAADCRIILHNDLKVNEAVLTGESFAQNKSAKVLKADTPLADQENMLFMSTTLIGGSGKAVIIATGMNTEFGKIAGLVQQIKVEKTPLEKKLDDFSKKIALVVLILAIFSIGVGIYRGENIFDMILTGIALAVSVIPEGVPAIIAVTLALAIGRMKKQEVLIRKLPAAETLGRTTVICVDKTGTLTEEEMTVTKLYCGKNYYNLKNSYFFYENKKIIPLQNFNISRLLKIGVMCNNARIEKDKDGEISSIIGDPTERAILISAEEAGIFKKEETEKEIRLKEYSFSSKRKMMSIVRKSNNQIISYVKGAPDTILDRSTKEFIDGRIIHLTEVRKRELHAVYENFASSALRVLAFAFKNVDTNFNQENAESGLIFVGFQGIMDPPRKEVKDSIRDCVSAGINVKMITGDSLLTAVAVSKMIGLDGAAIDERSLAGLSEEDFLEVVRTKNIFARITPQTKFRIVKALKDQGEIVAVTGDGVNDVLALKEAHLGIAMGIRGTDVARDVCDIILLDDNFASIVEAIKEGRKVYSNLKKSITAHISANLGELFVVLFALLISLPLPLMPLAILWMNLITDSLPSLALAVEVEDKSVMKRKPLDKNETILTGITSFLIVAGALSFIATISLFILFYAGDLAKARTIALTTAIFCEMFIVFSCRSNRNIWEVGWFSNKFLLSSIAIAICLQLIAIYTPLASVFNFRALSIGELLICILVSCPIMLIFEIKKYYSNKYEKNQSIIFKNTKLSKNL